MGVDHAQGQDRFGFGIGERRHFPGGQPAQHRVDKAHVAPGQAFGLGQIPGFMEHCPGRHPIQPQDLKRPQAQDLQNQGVEFSQGDVGKPGQKSSRTSQRFTPWTNSSSSARSRRGKPG